MDFLDKLGETITMKGKEVTDKAKDLAEIASLKSQIGTCEDVIKKNYIELGKLYYEKHSMTPDEECEEACSAITNAQNAIVDLQAKINEIKGI